ncbi:MAG: hypothetical protein JWQ70_879, partial [Aeromicrobium sp.]|nr:hypothetical protein [Aeromicrobium sp.]
RIARALMACTYLGQSRPVLVHSWANLPGILTIQGLSDVPDNSTHPSEQLPYD